MELIDRYVAEVGRNLPPRQRADIEAELRSLLVDSLEARSQGEPTQKEVVALLQEFGPPRKMAASYWPEGQYLIGPRLYPLFRMVAGIALLVVVIVQVVLFGVALIFTPEDLSVSGLLGNFIPTVVSAFGWVVLAFAIMQRLDVNPKLDEETWNPLDLPVIEEREPVSRLGTAVEIGFGLVVITVLSMLPANFLQILPAGLQVYISPVLVQYLTLVLLSTILGVGLNVVLLWRGKWEIGTRLARIALNLLGIFILALLINGHTAWLVERGASGFLTAVQRLPESYSFSDVQILAMQAYRLAFIVALIATLANTLRDGWQLARGVLDRSRVPSFPSPGAPSAG